MRSIRTSIVAGLGVTIAGITALVLPTVAPASPPPAPQATFINKTGLCLMLDAGFNSVPYYLRSGATASHPYAGGGRIDARVMTYYIQGAPAMCETYIGTSGRNPDGCWPGNANAWVDSTVSSDGNNVTITINAVGSAIRGGC